MATKVAHLLVAAIPLSWLLPQHYLPWIAAHQDIAALALLCAAGMLNQKPAAAPRLWALAIALALLSVIGQAAFGQIRFSGDAWLAAVYLLAFGGAITLGTTLAQGQAPASKWDPLDTWAMGILGAALASVAIALMQWTSTDSIPIPVARLLPGDRPYANFAQANQFCSALFLGLCALAWLRESRRLGAVGWYVAMPFLVLGMVMSGSRTAWLQLAAMGVIIVLLGRRHPLSVLRLWHVATVGLLFALLSVAWPAIGELTLLAGARSGAQLADAGQRPQLWWLLLDAITRHPLAGYGWLQVQSAQYAVALEHAPIQRYFEYSHNLLLDLVIWAGIPVGGTIAAIATLALARLGRNIVEPRSLWLFIAVLGIVVHAMLEFPLAYAYVLLPVGLAIGALHGLNRGHSELQIPLLTARAAWFGFGAGLLVIAIDYIEVEQNYRTVRLESTFGTRQIESVAPELRVLTQLQAYLQFIRTEARPGMSAEQVQQFRDIAARFSHPPVLLRLALAEGLNGHPEAARDTLARICALHTAQRCDEGRTSWALLQQRFPELGRIPAPNTPSVQVR